MAEQHATKTAVRRKSESSVLAVMTLRHSSEQEALERAAAMLDQGVAEHRRTFPSATVIDMSQECALSGSLGYRASIRAVLSLSNVSVDGAHNG